MTAVDDVRVEVAFSADPNTTSPVFVDLTSRARLDEGISISRGRQDEFDNVQAGQCTLTLDNTDGALTPGLASSPYYPNVKPQNRIRVTYRDPAGAAGNLLDAESASFEGGTTGSWANGFLGAPASVTISNSAVRASHGTKSMLVTFPTAAAGCGAVIGVSGLVKGRTYTAQCRVWVSAGVPAVYFGDPFGNTTTATSSGTGAWQTLSITFVSTGFCFLTVRSSGATTAGQQVWVDSVMVDEGSSVAAFTTAAPPISYRFDGYVDEWPTAWPTGGQSESTSTITAVDLQGRISRKRSLDSVIVETYRLTSPLWHFPLSEPSGSVSAGDRAGSGATLTVAQIGTGGEVEFGAGTGPGTDGSGAPMFTPVSLTNGRYLTGSVPGFTTLTAGLTPEVTFATSTAAVQTVARWSDTYGSFIDIGTDAVGHLVANYFDPWTGLSLTVTSTGTSYCNGETHTGMATLSFSGTTVTLSLLADGAATGGTAPWPSTSTLPPALNILQVGGTPSGRLFTGTISHVAGFGTALTAPTALEHFTATSTGFAGERSDQRLARIASWVGIPAGLQVYDVGQAMIGHVDSTGVNAWDYMQQVATTEAGLLFVSTDGLLTFYNRGRSYNTTAAVDVSLSAELVGPDSRIVNNLADIYNDVTVDRSGGASSRVVDLASQSEFGVLQTSVSLISATDAAAYDRASWILATRSKPLSRLPELTLDGLTDATTSPAVRRLDLDDRVQVTGMPSQSPATSFDLRVQGYREQIAAGGWFVTANTTPYLTMQPMIADDPVFGLADANNRAVY